MKNHDTHRSKNGFTIVELLVSMGITIVIISMIVTITSIALGAWRDSRNEVRASRQAKALLDVMAKDLESMVIRSGNNYEWFSAEADEQSGGNLDSATMAEVVFFTAATDRYNGNIGDATDDKGGDVSTVGYRMEIKDPVSGSSGDFNTFAMYRQLVNPDETFQNLLAQTDLTGAFGGIDTGGENFICENIYELSIVFLMEYTDSSNVVQQVRVPVISNGGVTDFSIKGSGIETSPAKAELANARLVSADLSITVISDHGLGLLRAAGSRSEE
ncbi:MAG: PulJ/GspJ family protein, partial [Verrucomicrobiales bacterium]